MKYTLKEISEIIENRDYITKERFVNFFKSMYEINENEAKRLFDIYSNLPFNIKKIVYEEGLEEKIDDILNKLNPLINVRKNHLFEYGVTSEFKKVIKKVYFENLDGDIIECVFDLNNSEDIINYAELLKKNKAIKVIDFFETIDTNNKDNRNFDVYDGDVFAIKEDWNKYEDGDIYLCTGGCYQKLLYTIGVGYMIDGEPNFDPKMHKKNHYGLTLCNGFKMLGNIYIDCSFLIDKDFKND